MIQHYADFFVFVGRSTFRYYKRYNGEEKVVASVTGVDALNAVLRLMAVKDPEPVYPFEVDIDLYGKIRC